MLYDIVQDRVFGQHYDPAADPASTKYRNCLYKKNWNTGCEANKHGSFFPSHQPPTLDAYDRSLSSPP